MEEVVYLNGSLMPRSQAHLSVYDQGFLYGYGLFETMRSYHGKIFLLHRHIKRLMEAAKIVGLSLSLSEMDLGATCIQTLEANGLEDARVRLTISGGEADTYPWGGARGNPTVLVTAIKYTPFPADKYRHGFKVGVASLRRCQKSPLSGIKSTSYLLSVLARMEAATLGLNEALLLNDKGLVAEGGSSNVFFIRDYSLVTPTPRSGLLPGVTRELVMELATSLGIIVNESEVSLDDLSRFDEAFLTNSMMEIMPLVSVRDEGGQTITISSGKPGPMTRRLTAAYKNRVEEETRPLSR